jgi:hypothetical protein
MLPRAALKMSTIVAFYHFPLSLPPGQTLRRRSPAAVIHLFCDPVLSPDRL